MSSQYYFFTFNSDQSYQKNDVVYGIFKDATSYSSPYFYATQNSQGYSPSGEYVYNISAYSRSEDIVTITYSHTGGLPFVAGSIIKIAGVSENQTVNFTGMVLRGGSGTLSYVNPGWNQAQSCGGTITCLSPGWTTGFMWIPTYTTKIGTQNNTITTQLGDGYTQRMPNGINTFTQTMNLVYQNIDKRQVRAMQNFVEDHAGAYPFEILLGDPFLNNQPNQKWVAGTIDVTPVAFNLYDVQIPVVRVFDP